MICKLLFHAQLPRKAFTTLQKKVKVEVVWTKLVTSKRISRSTIILSLHQHMQPIVQNQNEANPNGDFSLTCSLKSFLNLNFVESRFLQLV